MNLTSALISASAILSGTLGAVHLLYTFHGQRLHPRDPAVREAMMNSTPVITRETTVWRAALGFHASHSLGLMLFAAVYVYLAGWHAALLERSVFLLALGGLALLAWLGMARAFWFSIPFRGMALACLLYGAALLVRELS